MKSNKVKSNKEINKDQSKMSLFALYLLIGLVYYGYLMYRIEIPNRDENQNFFAAFRDYAMTQMEFGIFDPNFVITFITVVIILFWPFCLIYYEFMD